MRKSIKKLYSTIALVLMLTLMVIPAFAEDNEPEQEVRVPCQICNIEECTYPEDETCDFSIILYSDVFNRDDR